MSYVYYSSYVARFDDGSFELAATETTAPHPPTSGEEVAEMRGQIEEACRKRSNPALHGRRFVFADILSFQLLRTEES